MATLVGFEQSSFDEKRYKIAVCDNHGEQLTTEGILEGIAEIKKSIEQSNGNHWLTAMKETPAYIKKM